MQPFFDGGVESANLIVEVKLKKTTQYNDGGTGFWSLLVQRFPIQMELEVLQTFKGKSESKRILVNGDRGANCLQYLSKFEKSYFKAASQWVLALYKKPNSKEYDLSSCMESSFKIHKIRGSERIKGYFYKKNLEKGEKMTFSKDKFLKMIVDESIR